MYRQSSRRTFKQPPLPPPLPTAPPLPPPLPPAQPLPPLPGAQANCMPPQPQSPGHTSPVPQPPSTTAAASHHRPAPNIPKLMDLNLCNSAPPIFQPARSVMSSVQQLQDPTDTTGTLNPLHGKDIDRFEHVRPPEHAPLQQQLSSHCGQSSATAATFDEQHSMPQGANQQDYVTPGAWGGYSTSFDWSQDRNQSPCHSYSPGMWPNDDPNASEPSSEVTDRQPVMQPLSSRATWAEESCCEGVEPSWGWPQREPLSNPNWQNDGKYSYPNWHNNTGGLSDQLCDERHSALISAPVIVQNAYSKHSRRPRYHSPPHYAAPQSNSSGHAGLYEYQGPAMRSDGMRISLLPHPEPIGGDRFGKIHQVMTQEGGYTEPYDEGSHHYSADHIRRTIVPNEIYSERGQMLHPRTETFPRTHEYSSSSHSEATKTLASHFVVPAQPLFPIVAPVVLRPEVKIIQADKIFELPGRKDRPSHIVIVLRGLPGSGKSRLAKLIKEKETSHSAAAPRVISIDSYFLTEVEKEEKDLDTGRRTKRKVEQYEYDEAMEPVYRNSMFKLFVKTLEDGFFPMVVIDAVNHKVSHFDQYWSCAKMNGFEVYVAEVIESIDVCVHRNIHNRSKAEIEKLAAGWDETPPHFLRMDVTTLLSDSSIDEVEMESAESIEERGTKVEEANLTEQTPVATSRWEDATEDTLDKLDGFVKRKRLDSEADNQELSLKEYLSSKTGISGSFRKRVRWADLEEAKEEQRKKEIGFCIGSEWNKVSEEEATEILNAGVTIL